MAQDFSASPWQNKDPFLTVLSLRQLFSPGRSAGSQELQSLPCARWSSRSWGAPAEEPQHGAPGPGLAPELRWAHTSPDQTVRRGLRVPGAAGKRGGERNLLPAATRGRRGQEAAAKDCHLYFNMKKASWFHKDMLVKWPLHTLNIQHFLIMNFS